MTEVSEASNIIRKEQQSASTELINGIADLQDTLLDLVEGTHGLAEGELEAFKYADASLISFIESGPDFITAKPRSIREDDRKKILPGQHAGVFLQFGLADGTTLRVNFWGGLRVTSSHDLHDSDVTLANSHTTRTDMILQQSTDLNWQILYPGGLVIDSWMKFNPNNSGSFKQCSLKVDDLHVDSLPTVQATDSRFTQIKTAIFTPIDKLIKLVPNSV